MTENREGVLKNMVLDMTWEVRERLIRRDEREEGIAIGAMNAYMNLYLDGEISKEVAMKHCNMSEDEFDEKLKTIRKS